MVRRWSLIITTSKLLGSYYNTFQHFLFDVNINNVMYLRRSYLPVTVLYRRPWARRKHLSNWLVGSSVLKLWSKNYRFYRNLNKFVQNVFLTRLSFTTFGVNFRWNKVLSVLKTFPSLSTSFLNKAFFKGCRLTGLLSASALSSYRYLSPLFISWNQSISIRTFMNFFTYVDSSFSLYSTIYSSKLVNLSYVRFLTLIFHLWLVNFKLLYQSFILVLLPLLK
jgi:hypothetical protein